MEPRSRRSDNLIVTKNKDEGLAKFQERYAQHRSDIFPFIVLINDLPVIFNMHKYKGK